MESRVVGGRYLLLDRLERGGFGPAFRAEDRITGRQVVVTEIRLPGSADGAARPDRLRERLLDEVRSAGRLRHPGVVPVQDLIADRTRDGTVREHLVTEHPEARSLTQAMGGGSISARTAGEVGRDVLAALRAMHEVGVVHGGVTPDCVLVAADGRALLTDIGLARAVGPRAPTGERDVDPVAFVAPERRSGGPDTPAADLWSLGAVLEYAVGGRASSDGPLAEAIAGLTARDPADRLAPDDAAGLLARASRPRPGSGEPDRSRRLLLVVAAALFVVVVGLVLWSAL